MSLVKSNTLENQVTITGHQLEEIYIAKKKNLVLLKEVEVGNGVKEFGWYLKFTEISQICVLIIIMESLFLASPYQRYCFRSICNVNPLSANTTK